MCELFAMSAGQHYTAQDYLPLFADKARDNMSGWGIGFFREGQVHIEKSCEGIYEGDHRARQLSAPGPGDRQPHHHLPHPLPQGRASAGIPGPAPHRPFPGAPLALQLYRGVQGRPWLRQPPAPDARSASWPPGSSSSSGTGWKRTWRPRRGHSLYQGLAATCKQLISQLSRGICLFPGQRDGALRLSQPWGNPHLPPAGGSGANPWC